MPSRWHGLLIVALFAVAAPLQVRAGSAAIGSVIGSLNARIGQQPLLPNTAIFSGDNLDVGNGAAVVVLKRGGRMTLGRDTEGAFNIDSQAVTLVLARGIVSLFQEAHGAGLRVRAADTTVQTGEGNTAGTVARLGDAVVITTTRGILLVKRAGKVIRLIKGQTMAADAKESQGGATYKLIRGGNPGLEAGALATDAAALAMATVAASRVTDAHNTSNTANVNFRSATAAAGLANAVAVSAGCAINASQGANVPSPYIPPPGAACP
ncbi:MAG: hypothetical protein ACRD1O_03210 [Terriglobia bacterium]